MMRPVDLSSAAFVSPASAKSFACADLNNRVERLCKSPVFTGLSSQMCSETLQHARCKTFFRGEVLFSQGQIIDKLIVIQCGTVKSTQVSSDGDEVILWISGFGDTISLPSDTIGSCQTCSARAMERCETLVWDRKGIQLILDEHPQIKDNIGRILTTRLRELEERFCQIASEGVADRLAQLLLRLCKSIGKQRKYGIELRLRRQELAQMTGTTIFTVSRILSRWADLGLVDARRLGITVRDPDQLVDSSRREELAMLRCRHAS